MSVETFKSDVIDFISNAMCFDVTQSDIYSIRADRLILKISRGETNGKMYKLSIKIIITVVHLQSSYKTQKGCTIYGGEREKKRKTKQSKKHRSSFSSKKNQHEDLCLIVLKYMYNIQDSILTHPEEIIVLKNKNFNKKW